MTTLNSKHINIGSLHALKCRFFSYTCLQIEFIRTAFRNKLSFMDTLDSCGAIGGKAVTHIRINCFIIVEYAFAIFLPIDSNSDFIFIGTSYLKFRSDLSYK